MQAAFELVRSPGSLSPAAPSLDILHLLRASTKAIRDVRTYGEHLQIALRIGQAHLKPLCFILQLLRFPRRPLLATPVHDLQLAPASSPRPHQKHSGPSPPPHLYDLFSPIIPSPPPPDRPSSALPLVGSHLPLPPTLSPVRSASLVSTSSLSFAKSRSAIVSTDPRLDSTARHLPLSSARRPPRDQARPRPLQ